MSAPQPGGMAAARLKWLLLAFLLLSARWRVCSEGSWWWQPGCCDLGLGRVGTVFLQPAWLLEWVWLSCTASAPLGYAAAVGMDLENSAVTMDIAWYPSCCSVFCKIIRCGLGASALWKQYEIDQASVLACPELQPSVGLPSESHRFCFQYLKSDK